MRLVIVVGLTKELSVLIVEIDDLAPGDPLAGRAALMQALIAIGIKGPVMPVDADLDLVLFQAKNPDLELKMTSRDITRF